MVSDRAARRGQLILVGAVLVATIIFGLSLLLNSVLFTGAAGQNAATADVADVDQVDFEIKRGVRSTVLRVNHHGRNVSGPDRGAMVTRNVTLYSRLFAESRAAAQPVSINVTFDNASSEYGSRVVQDLDDTFTSQAGGSDWDPIGSTHRTDVGWATLNLEVSNTSEFSGELHFENASGDSIEYEFFRDGNNITVEDGVNSVECESEADRVLLDLRHGSSSTDDCTFRGIEELDGPVSLSIDAGDNLVGKYEFVVEDRPPATTARFRDCLHPSTDPTDPCTTPAVWSANVTTSVVGDSISYENEYDLSIYGSQS